MPGILEKLFGSASRIKVIRLFFSNPEKVFSPEEVATRAQINRREALRELKLLGTIGFIKATSAFIQSGAKQKKKKRIRGWVLQKAFPFFRELKNLVVSSAPIPREKLLRRLRNLGKVKLIILSGVFLQQDNSRLDVLVVGEGVKRPALEKVLRDTEAEIGKELSFALLTTDEFNYRLGMYDKFVRDILDYPHETLIDKIGVE